jgi:hypothetical protein
MDHVEAISPHVTVKQRQLSPGDFPVSWTKARKRSIHANQSKDLPRTEGVGRMRTEGVIHNSRWRKCWLKAGYVCEEKPIKLLTTNKDVSNSRVIGNSNDYSVYFFVDGFAMLPLKTCLPWRHILSRIDYRYLILDLSHVATATCADKYIGFSVVYQSSSVRLRPSLCAYCVQCGSVVGFLSRFEF